jgi:hypothetical protein
VARPQVHRPRVREQEPERIVSRKPPGAHDGDEVDRQQRAPQRRVRHRVRGEDPHHLEAQFVVVASTGAVAAVPVGHAVLVVVQEDPLPAEVPTEVGRIVEPAVPPRRRAVHLAGAGTLVGREQRRDDGAHLVTFGEAHGAALRRVVTEPCPCRLDVDGAGERRRPVAEPAVDRALARGEDGGDLAALVRQLVLAGHQPGEHPLAPVRRQDTHPRDAAGRHERPARHAHAELDGARDADDVPVLHRDREARRIEQHTELGETLDGRGDRLAVGLALRGLHHRPDERAVGLLLTTVGTSARSRVGSAMASSTAASSAAPSMASKPFAGHLGRGSPPAATSRPAPAWPGWR